MADEGDYLDLVIAGELVEQWLEVIRTSARVERVKEAAEKLRKGIERSEAYAEEAVEGGAQEILRQFLDRPTDEWGTIFPHIHAMLTKLDEHIERHGTIMNLKYGDYEIRIREGALNDGLGARIWKVAHVLNRYLVYHPELLHDKKILELGSGCGSTGILAAIIAPSSTVTLTDCVPSVLENLRMCCRLNSPSESASKELDSLIEQMNDDSIEALLGDDNAEDNIDAWMTGPSSWDNANMRIRYADWTQTASSSSGINDRSAMDGLPPELTKEDGFDLVLGCEVLYEEWHSKAVAGIIKERMLVEGRCLVVGAVREQEIFDAFEQHCQELNLQIRKRILDTNEVEMDATEYEGGIVLYAIDHCGSNSWTNDWIRLTGCDGTM